ncbi:hypothetical protein [Photorhabdus bodei]|nr:hypothetical protein [Photorhabdus bodei]
MMNKELPDATLIFYTLDNAVLTSKSNIPVIFQVASLLAALTHPGHIVL